MKNLTLGFLALATAIAIAPTAFADTITGSLGIGGGNDQWSATGITFTNPSATARDATGDFAILLGASPATTPAIINGAIFNFATPDELIFTVSGPSNATFTITGPIDVSLDNGEFLDISGTGILTLAGYSPTPATFSFDSTDSSGDSGASGSSTYGFDVTATTTSVTPEPASFFLLGSGLLGLAGMVRRKLSR